MDLCGYIAHFQQCGVLEDNLIVTSMVLLNRIILAGARVSKNEIFKIYATCLYLAIKLIEDECEFWSREDWSMISGIREEEVRPLEIEVLVGLLKFDVHIPRNEYRVFYNMIKNGSLNIDLFTSHRIKGKPSGHAKSCKKFKSLQQKHTLSPNPSMKGGSSQTKSSSSTVIEHSKSI